MAAATKNINALLSRIATGDGHAENSPYFDGWKAYDHNPYDPMTRPDGVIQMGLAENQLSFDLVEEWIKENPEASIGTPQGVSQFKDVALFQDYHGLHAFRKAVASFMGKVRGGRVEFDPDRVVMAGGATGAQETMAFCLADPGDAFLVPTPYYAGFDRDLTWRTRVRLLPVDCESSDGFRITRAALEIAYKRAQEAEVKVKGLLITNPSNPLGTTLDAPTLRTLVRFVNEKGIHLICDEIYAATVFAQPRFVSISEIIAEEGMQGCNTDLIHVVYSLSKDFGFPGFRVGVIYSYNDTVVSTARRMSSFGLVSSQTQHFLSAMLSDERFVDGFLTESSRRLASRHATFTRELQKVGIGCLESNAGLFCWMDLRGLLAEKTEAGEAALWRTIVDEVRLNVSPGSSFHCSEPGWFRVCFANMDDETMTVALERIKAFVSKSCTVRKSSSRAQRWQPNLRLSFCARRFEEGTMTPRLRTKTPLIMSPHSPLVPAAR